MQKCSQNVFQMNNYPANINPAAVQLLNEFSNHLSKLAVLELGCNFGALGKYFGENNNTKQIDWYGIDYNKEAVEIAKSQIKDAFCYNLNNITSVQLRCIKNIISPDIILMIDTLEHLVSPERILSLLLTVFPQTPLLIILPNISCLTIVDQLSRCEFNYTQHGILDFTHLKHFTPISAIRFLDKYGYKVEKKPLFLNEPCLNNYRSLTTFPSEIKYNNLVLNIESQEQLETLISFGFGFVATPQ